MLYAAAAVECAMKIQPVVVRALSGAITWLQAADILELDVFGAYLASQITFSRAFPGDRP